jgi:hypothetical protein
VSDVLVGASCLRAAGWMFMEELYYEWMGGRMPAQIATRRMPWSPALEYRVAPRRTADITSSSSAELVLRALLPDVSRLSVDALRVEQAIFCAGMQRPAPDG